MAEETYKIYIEADNEVSARRGMPSLINNLREAPGVLEVERQKENDTTMDLGTILTIIASSEAALAIAQGIADWIRRNRGVRLTIEKNEKSGSIKAEVENIDRATSLKILEIIRGT